MKGAGMLHRSSEQVMSCSQSVVSRRVSLDVLSGGSGVRGTSTSRIAFVLILS